MGSSRSVREDVPEPTRAFGKDGLYAFHPIEDRTML